MVRGRIERWILVLYCISITVLCLGASLIHSTSRKRCSQGTNSISSGRWLKTQIVIKIEFTPLPDWIILPFLKASPSTV